MELLNKELFAGVTVLHALLAFIGIMLLLWLVEKIRGKKEEEGDVHVAVKCGCGWTGKVSKFTRRCPKCNADIPKSSFTA